MRRRVLLSKRIESLSEQREREEGLRCVFWRDDETTFVSSSMKEWNLMEIKNIDLYENIYV